MESNSKSNHITIVIVGIVFFIIILFLLYFFAWRPSDQEYQTLADQVGRMETAQKSIASSLNSAPFAIVLNPDKVTLLKNASGQYDTSLKELSNNLATSRDLTLKSAIDAQKNDLSNYGNSVRNLIVSLNKYHSIQIAYKNLMLKIGKLSTVAGFDAAAKDCNSAITDAKSAPYQPFKDQFLNEFITDITELLKTQRQIVSLAEKGVQSASLTDYNNANDKILKLDAKKLNLIPTPDPAVGLQKLSDVVTTQKSAFLR